MNIMRGVGIMVIGLALLPLPGWADTPTFTELLARAHAEAAAGKQWSPAGDNVVETSVAMMALLSEATPEQVDDFGALLRRQQMVQGREQQEKTVTPPPGIPTVPEAPKAVTAKAAPVAGSVNKREANPSSERLAAEMFASGKEAEAHNNISGARRYYEVAAENQHGGAARALGRLYDPEWLGQRFHGGIKPDPEAAQKWYQRADVLDGGKSNQLSKTFSTR